jgi:hypothetical protein
MASYQTVTKNHMLSFFSSKCKNPQALKNCCISNISKNKKKPGASWHEEEEEEECYRRSRVVLLPCSSQ